MIENEGWISLHRKTLKNPVLEKNPEALYLWIYLLLKANHKDNPVRVGLQTIVVHRGQHLTGRKTLAERTGIQESKIERLLKFLKSEQMIEQQSFTKFRLITITNYNTYQDHEQQKNNKRTASEQQVNTNNNDNNDNNDNKKKVTTKKLSFSDDDLKAANYIYGLILKLNPDYKKPNLDKWSSDIRLMTEVDKRTHKEICSVFKWANQDDFWKSNILSPAKLRKQFDNLKTKSMHSTTSVQLLRVPTEGDLVEFANKHGLQEPAMGMHDREFRFALNAEIKEKQLRG